LARSACARSCVRACCWLAFSMQPRSQATAGACGAALPAVVVKQGSTQGPSFAAASSQGRVTDKAARGAAARGRVCWRARCVDGHKAVCACVRSGQSGEEGGTLEETARRRDAVPEQGLLRARQPWHASSCTDCHLLCKPCCLWHLAAASCQSVGASRSQRPPAAAPAAPAAVPAAAAHCLAPVCFVHTGHTCIRRPS
jgi:hypothetical protein